MGQDQALGAVAIIPQQHLCREGLARRAQGSWGCRGLKAARTPWESPPPSIFLGQQMTAAMQETSRMTGSALA